jgi:cytochrome c556
MKSRWLGVTLGSTALLLLLVSWNPVRSEGDDLPDAAAPATAVHLPASLSALYPPAATEPVYLLAMHALNAALAGLVADLGEGDMPGVRANFEQFRGHYQKTSDLVPEWKSSFPMEPVQALAAALEKGTPEEIMPAVGRVGAVCHSCHLQALVPAQQAFHWPSFGDVSVHDPVTEAELDFAAFKQMLNANLVGIGVDLEQGQPANAKAQFEGFAARMDALKETCESCHDTERRYYVDQSVTDLIASMRLVLDSDPVDAKAVGQISRRVGESSCSGCHLVHMPAAYSGLQGR